MIIADEMSLLLQNLLGRKPSGFGLEIEDRSLKVFAIERKRRKGCRVLSCFVRNIRKGIVQDGQINDAEALSREIQELLSSAKPRPVTNKFVVFSVPETKAFIRTITIPTMERKEAEEAVKWETEANIPVAVEKVNLDWQVIEEKKGSSEILVTAVSKDVVNGYCEVMSRLGLEILAVEVDVIATVRSLTSGKELAGKAIMVVDIGEDRTSLAVSCDEIPYFTSSIPLSGQTFTDALQKGLGVSFEKAEELKRKYGLEKMQGDDALYKIYNPLIENLSLEIEKSIRFYEENIGQGKKVEKVVLSGGGSLLKKMPNYLTQRIKKEISLGNPLLSLGMKGGYSDSFNISMAPFATVIGLAERACDCDD